MNQNVIHLVSFVHLLCIKLSVVQSIHSLVVSFVCSSISRLYGASNCWLQFSSMSPGRFDDCFICKGYSKKLGGLGNVLLIQFVLFFLSTFYY